MAFLNLLFEPEKDATLFRVVWRGTNFVKDKNKMF